MRNRLLPSSVLGQIFMPEYTNRKEQTKFNGLSKPMGFKLRATADHMMLSTVCHTLMNSRPSLQCVR